MPKKARPSPLAESIFREKLAELQSSNEATDVSALPVHNTFIQFGSPNITEGAKQRLATAPAWIGTTSFQSTVREMMQEAATQSPSTSEEAPAEPSLPGTADSEKSMGLTWLGFPKKVPVLLRSEGGALGGDAPPKGAWMPEEAGCKDTVDKEPPVVRQRPRGPMAAPGDMPSRGSAGHNDGLCKRCCFFPKGRCTNGFDCEFCHLEHDKRKRKKKKKSKGKAQDSDDSDSSDDERENKAPVSAGKSAQECAAAQAAADAEAWPFSAPPPPASPPPSLAPEAAQLADGLSAAYDTFFTGAFDFSAISPAVGVSATSPPTPVAPSPLADASARVPFSPLHPPFVDPMAFAAGFGLGSPGFIPGVYSPGSPLLPAVPPMPPPTPASLPAALQGVNAVQAGSTLQNASVLPGVGLPPPR